MAAEGRTIRRASWVPVAVGIVVVALSACGAPMTSAGPSAVVAAPGVTAPMSDGPGSSLLPTGAARPATVPGSVPTPPSLPSPRGAIATEPPSTDATPSITTGAPVPTDPGAVTPAAPGPDRSWPEPIAASVAAFVLAGLAAGAGYWAGRRRPPRRDPSPPPSAGRPRPDDHLVQGLIGSYDLADDDAQRGHVEQVLRRVGVVALRPEHGDLIDDSCHQIVGTVPTTSATHVGAVAGVVRAGWTDGVVLLRPAQVTVLTTAPSRTPNRSTSS